MYEVRKEYQLYVASIKSFRICFHASRSKIFLVKSYILAVLNLFLMALVSAIKFE